MHAYAWLTILFLVLIRRALAAIHVTPSTLPSLTFDFVIIGGGPGGSVVANRLTEDPNVTVLLLEAGGSQVIASTHLILPLFVVFLASPSPRDWNYSSIPQKGLDNQTLFVPRAKILGGCSSISNAHLSSHQSPSLRLVAMHVDGMLYLRGSSEDWDRFANITGDDGWSWEGMQQYFFKNEKWTPPVDRHNTTGQFDPNIHGFHGINSVSVANFPTPIDGKVLEAASQLGAPWPFNLDPNSGNHLGVGWVPDTIKDGTRSSAAKSYLAPEFVERKNLHVLLNAHVRKVVNRGMDGSKLVFGAVQFAQADKATKEVIISAGSINTPQLLLLSGIGPKSDLNALSLPTLLDLPSVGANLSVHIALYVSHAVNSADTFDDIIRNATLREQFTQEWLGNGHRGRLADTETSQAAFVRLPQDADIFKREQDPAAGPHTGHIQMGIYNGNPSFGSNSLSTGNFITVSARLITPTSRGSVKLNTTDPFNKPLIDLGSLTSEFDKFALREGVKIVRGLFTAPVWDGYILGEVGALANATTDEEIEAVARTDGAPDGHIVGTAAMSHRDALFGVVDPDLKVKGANGLRVVDASIFVSTGNTQVPTYAVGERAADLIKADWGLL
ncbi:aryl-alcohol oxidase [Vararia minispora EC-137]|uniref:Aryl-alcohol oxidase n=1 Tax=Vararia minispora EC-137 TaxID=1314806 RepID=A0ACB8QU07_9AGAM|nr:aryl-alcohol oxidase [Vararia minispora EC-137]